MKTAEEILEKKLIECDSGFERGVYIDGHGNYDSVIQAMKEYAIEVAKEALKNASENVNTIVYNEIDEIYEIDKQSILNESNIPTL